MSAYTPPSTLATFRFSALVSAQRSVIRSRRLMLALSRVIEDVAATAPDTTLIATFQRMTLFQFQHRRYTRLTPQLRHTYLLGYPDTTLPDLPRSTVIPIEETWPLIHEWVVIANGPTCCAALVAHDTQQLQPQGRSLQFRGSWIIEPAVVDQLWAGFHAALGRALPPIQRDQHATIAATKRLQEALAAANRR